MNFSGTLAQKAIVAAFAAFAVLLAAYFTASSSAAGPHGQVRATGVHNVREEPHVTTATTGVTGQLFRGSKDRTYRGPIQFSAESIQPGNALNPQERRKKWAVCTTIHKPTDAIINIAREEDWAVVIVGDEGTPPFHLQGSNAVYLDVAAQKSIEAEHLEYFRLLPWKHFGRKNVGFLYAIAHGAEMVWDFDDDNYLKNGVWPAVPAKVYDVTFGGEGCPAFNPYPAMGAPDPEAWPRGYPLTLLRSPCNHSLVTGDPARVAVLQSLADHEPDVDGIFRLTRKTPFNFDGGVSATLVIPAGTLTPWNAQATLFLGPALWSLILPVTVHGRVSDIWRSYFAQRLLWDVGLKIAFTSPWVNQFRNPHNPLADMRAEDDLYFRSLALVEFLRTWTSELPTLPGRMEALMIDVYERGYIELADVQLTQAWLGALVKVGYTFPPIREAAFVKAIQAPPPDCPRFTRVFVTGISGMIGSHVARVLVAKTCYKVYGLVRPRSNLDTLVGLLDKMTLVTGDITDAPRMVDLMETIRPDYVYHFAAQAINGISYDVPELTLDTNVIGTMNILEALRRLGLTTTRVLMAGSSTEYGRTADTWPGPIPESAPLDPVSPYGVSKLTTEKLGNQYNMTFGIPVITARFFIQVGVGGTDSLAIHQFCRQIAMAEAGLSPPRVKHGNLMTSRDMTDARDSAPIVVMLAEQGVAGEAYNIGTGLSMTMQDLLDTAISLAKVPVQGSTDASRFRLYDEKVLLADISKVQALTGWVPATDMRDTVESILHYWRRRIVSLYGAGVDAYGGQQVPGSGKDPLAPKPSPPLPTPAALPTPGTAPAQPSQPPALTPSPAAAPSSGMPCSTANVDLFLVTYQRDFPLTTFLMRSVESFMPCHGKVHVLIDEGDRVTINAWADALSPDINMKVLTIPPVLNHIDNYIGQAWAMMWADRMVQESGSTADYVMFLDTDSVLGVPVTCKALFDDAGRVKLAGWQLTIQPQFEPTVTQLIGPSQTSYMSFMPFTMPMPAFARMRKHIVKQITGSEEGDFDAAFSSWTKKPGIVWRAFSQFAGMGAFLELFEKDLAHAMPCPQAQPGSSACGNWTPVGVHYGWRPCTYLGTCVFETKSVAYFQRAQGSGGEFEHFSGKFSMKSIRLVEEVISAGVCYKHWLTTGALLPGCKQEHVSSLHPEIIPYPNQPQDMARWNDVFKADPPGLCRTPLTIGKPGVAPA